MVIIYSPLDDAIFIILHTKKGRKKVAKTQMYNAKYHKLIMN